MTLARNAQKEFFDRSKFKVTRDISPTISGWLLVSYSDLLELHMVLNLLIVVTTVGKSQRVRTDEHISVP